VELVPPTTQGGGPLEIPAEKAVSVGLARRLDLRTAIDRVQDAQRQVVVAGDALRAGLTLTGSGQFGQRRQIGSAGSENARLRPERGIYTAGLLLDPPLERTAERNAYRNSFIALERATRDAQELEDQVKLQVRDALRDLLQARESYTIQAQAVTLALRRVASTELFLEAGRAQIRDVLEAQEALVSAQNALTAAIVRYRVAELELQRDMGVLEVDEKGNWREYQPDKSDQK
jgi:outer membrane protein TolC